MKSNHLPLPVVVYVSLFFILFPGYRYVIDPDPTRYFIVGEQLAKGNFHNSVSGIRTRIKRTTILKDITWLLLF